MKHLCHAEACQATVPPKLLMCAKHWRMVPKVLQDEVWALYIPGQEVTKDPTIEYLECVHRVIEYVHTLEMEAYLVSSSMTREITKDGLDDLFDQ